MSLNMYNVLMYNPVTVYMHCKTNMAGQADTEDRKTACKEIVQDVQLQTARVKHLKNKRRDYTWPLAHRINIQDHEPDYKKKEA